MNDEWLDQHQAAAVSGYNARSLRNMAKAGKLPAEKRTKQRPTRGPVESWHFKRTDMERLAAARRSATRHDPPSNNESIAQ